MPTVKYKFILTVNIVLLQIMYGGALLMHHTCQSQGRLAVKLCLGKYNLFLPTSHHTTYWHHTTSSDLVYTNNSVEHHTFNLGEPLAKWSRRRPSERVQKISGKNIVSSSYWDSPLLAWYATRPAPGLHNRAKYREIEATIILKQIIPMSRRPKLFLYKLIDSLLLSSKSLVPKFKNYGTCLSTISLQHFIHVCFITMRCLYLSFSCQRIKRCCLYMW